MGRRITEVLSDKPAVHALRNCQTPEAAQVVIIGGGFCGAFCAAQLAEKSSLPVEITVIEPRETLGGGVAYSSADPAHRINVPAVRMTLFPDDPTHFDKWLRAGTELLRDPAALWKDGRAYPRRAAFGAYVAELVAQRGSNRPDVTISHLRDIAVSVRRQDRKWRIETAGGIEVGADIIVLATSHPPPKPPDLLMEKLAGDAALIADPWAPGTLDSVALEHDVLIVGTGLTMADIIASLGRRGHTGQITAFSRRGQRSREHAFAAEPFAWVVTTAAPATALELSRTVRRAVAAALTQNIPWQVVLDDVRANGQMLWAALNITERRRFLRHLRSFWNAHRYRVAPQIAAEIARRQSEGSLRVRAASLRDARRVGRKIEVTIHPRGTGSTVTERVLVDNVIVTTGPAHGSVIDTISVLRDLADQGFLRADSLGLGIAADAAGRIIATDGATRPDLFVAGPLAREQYGELMGLPQVAAQPAAVAAEIAQELTVLHQRRAEERL
jgi:uncharacterized NAD(P)/FAD-binding protein YdhS